VAVEATPKRVVLGRVASAHGLRGQLRVTVLGDGPENLLGAPWLELSFDREDPLRDASPRRYAVTYAAVHGERQVRLGLEGVLDRDGALALRGAFVLGDAAHLAPLAEGEHYWFELVGCRAESEAGRTLGTVREIWETGAHDVLVIEDAAGREHLIPAREPFLRQVDAAGRRIVVATVPGLLADEPGATG
jgi:16S rRNA processing protein RimM